MNHIHHSIPSTSNQNISSRIHSYMAERDNSFGEHQRVPANGHSFQLPTNIVDVHHGKPVRLQVKVIVPVNDHPNVMIINIQSNVN